MDKPAILVVEDDTDIQQLVSYNLIRAGFNVTCADTGEEIGLDRLEARLTAERTIDAQERWEHLQKQQGD